jgi:hypothetical protein
MKVVMKFAILAIGLAGCATQGTNSVNYTKHEPKTISNEIIVNQPYSQVWDKLVRELSKSFYVINNIDKESRIINLSFSTQSPTEYVDCGQTHRTYKQGNKVESFDYNVADSSNFKLAAPTQPAPAFSYYALISRNASLEGRSNIYLAPLENDKAQTTVAVNTRYMLTINMTGEAYAQHVNGNIFPQGSIPHANPTIIAFNTNKPTEHDFGAGVDGVKVIATCFSNGKLEQDVLQILKK